MLDSKRCVHHLTLSIHCHMKGIIYNISIQLYTVWKLDFHCIYVLLNDLVDISGYVFLENNCNLFKQPPKLNSLWMRINKMLMRCYFLVLYWIQEVEILWIVIMIKIYNITSLVILLHNLNFHLSYLLFLVHIWTILLVRNLNEYLHKY